MHPNAAFRLDARDDPLARLADYAFGRIFAMTPEGPRIAHAPILRVGADRLRFHLANANSLCRHLDGATVLVVGEGPNGYISANWYDDVRSAVPTWNYSAVEAEGVVAPLDRAALIDLLDGLAATLEPRVGENWTRDKMESRRFDAMLHAITAFEMTVTAVRSTDKRSQNKPAAERDRLIAALDRSGNRALAAAMRAS